jgi:hypothetical protein
MTTDGLVKMLFENEIKEVLQESRFENSAYNLKIAARNPRRVAEYIAAFKKENPDDVLKRIIGNDAITIITIKVKGENDDKK